MTHYYSLYVSIKQTPNSLHFRPRPRLRQHTRIPAACTMGGTTHVRPVAGVARWDLRSTSALTSLGTKRWAGMAAVGSGTRIQRARTKMSGTSVTTLAAWDLKARLLRPTRLTGTIRRSTRRARIRFVSEAPGSSQSGRLIRPAGDDQIRGLRRP